jgi:hypothetical protein
MKLLVTVHGVMKIVCLALEAFLILIESGFFRR